jgi:hypothetical protein
VPSRARERHHLLGVERLRRLAVVLTALVGPAHRVVGQREAVRARRVLEDVGERLAVGVDASAREALAIEAAQEALNLGRGDLGDAAVAEGAHDAREALPAAAGSPARRCEQRVVVAQRRRLEALVCSAHSRHSRTASANVASRSGQPPAPSGSIHARPSRR